MTEFLPHAQTPLVGGEPMSPQFYDAFRRAFKALQDRNAELSDAQASILAILQSLGAEDVESLEALGDLLAGKQDADEALDALAQLTAAGLLSFTGGNFQSRTLSPVAGETTVTNGNGVAGNPTVGLADVANSGAGTLQAITRDGKGRITGAKAATITGTAGRVTVANGDAAAGLPTIDLATVADAGGGTLQRTAFDTYGRKTGTSAATTDHLAEGATNLYHTAARVRAVVLTGLSTATNAVITATDTVLSAFGKLQAQVSSNLAALTSHTGNTSNPHAVTKAQVGLGNADNTSDANKPVSTAQQTALNLKADLAGPSFTSSATVTGANALMHVNTSSDGTFARFLLSAPTGQQAYFIFRTSTNVRWLVGKNDTAETGSDAGSDFYIRRTTDAGAQIDCLTIMRATGHFRAGVDNAQNMGTASFRWKEVFAGTATINTSDAREKTPPRDLTAQELACASDLARLPCVFQWLHAIEEKGDGARLHVSPTVQSVIACMESHGLDPFRYGFVCYDAWDEEVKPAVLDEAGNEVEPATIIPPGDRYSLRPTELHHFIMRGTVAWQDAFEAWKDALKARQDALEARQDALEARLAAMGG